MIAQQKLQEKMTKQFELRQETMDGLILRYFLKFRVIIDIL